VFFLIPNEPKKGYFRLNQKINLTKSGILESVPFKWIFQKTQPFMTPQNMQTLRDLVTHLQNFPDDRPAFGWKIQGKWQTYSGQQCSTTIKQLAAGLHSLGIRSGDRVGLMAQSSPFWLMADLALSSQGAVSVPLFANISPTNFEAEICEAELTVLFVDSLEGIGQALKLPLTCKHLILMPPLDQRSSWPESLTQKCQSQPQIFQTWTELIEQGQALLQTSPNLWNQLAQSVSPHCLATLIYTSGSTGVPKGVMLTHANLVSQIQGAAQRYPLNSQDLALSVLPLAHVFEHMVTLFYIASGVPVYFADDPKQIASCLSELKPTVLTVVPRLLEKIYSRIFDSVQQGKGFKRWLGIKALKRASHKSPDTDKTFADYLYNSLVYKKIRAKLGGCLRLCICGSAPLPTYLNQFYLNIHVPLFEGYGCTETSPVLTANFPENRQVGTVGKAFPGVELSIDKEGEVITRGPHVMQGYYKRPQETAQVLDSEGWYHTGDLGEINSAGFLYLKGRKKELFKTDGGKFVAPLPIETALVASHPLIEMSLVIAEGRKFVTALLVPEFEKIPTYKKKLKLEHLSDTEFLQSPKVEKIIKQKLLKINRNLNQWEKVQKVLFVPAPLTVEGGDLTPTLKIRRKFVEEKYHQLIESLYLN